MVLAVRNKPKALMLGHTISEIHRKELLSVQWMCLVGTWFEGGFTLTLVHNSQRRLVGSGTWGSEVLLELV
jgi:hypothetical protein